MKDVSMFLVPLLSKNMFISRDSGKGNAFIDTSLEGGKKRFYRSYSSCTEV